MPEKRQRIGFLTALLMVLLALIFDGVQFLVLILIVVPGIGFVLQLVSYLITGIAFVTFLLWFTLCGVSLIKGKRAAMKMITALASCIVELVPLLDAIPTITFGVVALIIQTRIEDSGMTGAGVQQVLGGVGQMAKAVRIPGAGMATKALGGGAPEGGPSRPNPPRSTPPAGGDQSPTAAGAAPRGSALRQPPSTAPTGGGGPGGTPNREQSVARTKSGLRPPPASRPGYETPQEPQKTKSGLRPPPSSAPRSPGSGPTAKPAAGRGR
jgi:hypothetical protein